MTAGEAMPKIEGQRGFPAGNRLPVLARPEMPLEHFRDQCRHFIAHSSGHLGQEWNGAVLAPCEPRLEMKMPLQDGIRQQLGRSSEVRCSQDLVDRKRRRGCSYVRGAS